MKDHSFGLHVDLPHLLKRRKALAVLTSSAGMALLSPTVSASCVADSRETAGPYPANGTGITGFFKNVLRKSGVVREDIRPSFAGLEGVAGGTPLTLDIQVLDAASDCRPLAGRPVYIWHCDTDGAYSLYDIKNQNYLRGVGVTDESGQVRFVTSFPGCYAIRWPHIHFEVFESTDKMRSGRHSVLTSQFAFDGADCKNVYQGDAIYRESLSNLSRNSIRGDFEFRDDSAEQTQQRTIAISDHGNNSLKGTVTVGMPAARSLF